MKSFIPLEVKKTCVEMHKSGVPPKNIFYDYFKKAVPQSVMDLTAFRSKLGRWERRAYPDELTLERGTYEGFVAHGATVQVSGNGEIVQAWIKQSASDLVDPEEFVNLAKGNIPIYKHELCQTHTSDRMLEIPLFDMHWGINYLEDYDDALNEILEIINSHEWDQIVIPFGQDFFHNDSIVNGVTTKGTQIEKVDMVRAERDAITFIYTIIDASFEKANSVKILYTPGNHDFSISWMFIQILAARYGHEIVDDTIAYRKIITYGRNAIMLTHGDAKHASSKNLAHVFPTAFPIEFSSSDIREIHAGHLHDESDTDIHGIMVRRLSTGAKIDSWSDKEDYVGTMKRFMVFEWDTKKLKSIHYI